MTGGEDRLDKTPGLLDQLPQDVPPRADERDRIEQRMWAAFAASQETNGVRSVDQEGLLDSSNPDSTFGASELVRLVKDGASDKRGWPGQRLVLQAATVLVLLVAAGLFIVLSQGRGDVETVGPAEPPTASVLLGDAVLRFELPPGATVTTLSDRLAVVNLSGETTSDFDGDLSADSIVIARPLTLFDGRDAAEFFADRNIFVRPQLIELEERVETQSWSLAVDRTLAAELGCVEGGACVPFAELGDETADLAFQVGTMNDLDVFRDPSGEVVVVFGFTNSQRPNRDPILLGLTVDFG